jgi:uncharacterized protein YidB (DUF937 family)
MGLLDAILGNMTGGGGGMPRTRASGGMGSPLVKALLLILAAKAAQNYRSGNRGGAGAQGGLGGILGQMMGQGGSGGLAGGLGGGTGGLGGLLGGGAGGGLGGLLAGLGGGGALGGLLDQFRQNGYGEHVDSWVGTGQNRRIAPQDLMSALGPDTVAELEEQSGMPRDQVLAELSSELPDAVDGVTPEGRLPSDDEITAQLYGDRR